MALGSAVELETQLLIVQRLYPNISVDSTITQLTEVQKMLSGLVKKLPTNNYQLVHYEVVEQIGL
jgi:four helix bundle protein